MKKEQNGNWNEILSVIIPKKYSTRHGRQLAKRQGIIWILCYSQPDEGIKVK